MVDMVLDGVVVVAPFAEAIDIATAATYICPAACVAAPNNNIQNIACMLNTTQYFAYISI